MSRITEQQKKVTIADEIAYNYRVKGLEGAVSRYKQGKGTKKDVIENFMLLANHPCTSTRTKFSNAEEDAISLFAEWKEHEKHATESAEAELSC